MTRELFATLMNEVADVIGGRAVDTNLGEHLNRTLPAEGDTFRRIEEACHAGVDAGWMCKHEAGGIRYGRVLRPDAVQGLSVDVVYMNDVRGPRHKHPKGEIDMIMPIDSAACFDGHGRGWCVYAPGSEHYPTVTGGAALVLYLLPEGDIEFT
ncbi:MAG: DUF4863 family protein [Gammaproteobacteria bacterium]|nr:DUF4863 family protein [Gammaproteobacteria bacterium]